jgi:hypothetical protein
MHRRSAILPCAVAVAAALVLASPLTAAANVPIQVVSTDPYTNTSSYHRTQVEPDTFSFGNTIVSAFQSGRFVDGGASNIGWATSKDSGATWTHGFLPGTTIYANPAGPYARDTDPAVAYDPKHDVWLIFSLPLDASVRGVAVIVNRSTDGGLTWGNPVIVRNASGFSDFDKTWIACDTWAASPNYGRCYTEWDDFGQGNTLEMSTSADGGLTWHAASTPGSTVIAGVPVAQPNGKVIMPIDDGFESSLLSFVSTDGGRSYTGPTTVTSISSHGEAGSLRSGPLPSAEVDAAGKVYVVWGDCRFRSGCPANDIVMTTTTNGTAYTSVVRIPIDPVSSTVDHFLPGIAVDPTTSGGSAHIGITYYYYPQSNCSTSTCQLNLGFIESTDGGASWSSAVQVAGPFKVTWFANTSQGYMVGDYISTSFGSNGKAYPVVAAAKQGTCTLGQVTSCKNPMIAPTNGLSGGPETVPTGSERPVPGASSDHPVGGLKQVR